MTAEEQQMIQSLADRIDNTQLNEKDPGAEQFLQQVLGRNPDAMYILAQTTLVQQYALEQAQKQLADARAELERQRQQAQQPRHATSFLGNLLGRHEEPAPPPPPPYTPVPNYGQPGRSYTPGGSSFSGPGSLAPPPYGYAQPQYGGPQYSEQQYGQQQSGGFLRSALQTATGVAAGALAFEGIESLMHGFGGSGGSNFGSNMGGRPEEIINNNYYGGQGPAEHRELSSDIEDRRHESGSFGDAVDRGDHNYGHDDNSSGRDGNSAGRDDTSSGRDDNSFEHDEVLDPDASDGTGADSSDATLDGNGTDDATFDDSSNADDSSSFDDQN